MWGRHKWNYDVPSFSHVHSVRFFWVESGYWMGHWHAQWSKEQEHIICFNKIMISGCWSTWNHRIIFDNKGANIETYLFSSKKHFCIITKTSKPSLKEGSRIVRHVISFLHLLYIYTCTLSIILIENESQLGFNLLYFFLKKIRLNNHKSCNL